MFGYSLLVVFDLLLVTILIAAAFDSPKGLLVPIAAAATVSAEGSLVIQVRMAQTRADPDIRAAVHRR